MVYNTSISMALSASEALLTRELSSVSDSREARVSWRLLAGLQEVCFRKVRDVGGHFEATKGG